MLARTFFIRFWTESPNSLASIMVGVTITPTASRTIRVAASPCLLPIRAANIWWRG